MTEFDVVFLTDNHNYRNPWSRSCGPYRLKTWLKTQGFNSFVLDAFLMFEPDEVLEIMSKLISDRTRVVGVSTTFLFFREFAIIKASIAYGTVSEETYLRSRSREWLTEVLTRIKARWPKVEIVIGGAMSPYFQGKFDFKILGYGEEALLRILNERNDLNLRLNPVLNGTDRFDPEWGIEYDDDDLLVKGETLTVEVSRGCRFKCKFCNFPLNGRKSGAYTRDPKSFTAELDGIYEQNQTRHIVLADDTFNESEEKVNDFCNALNEARVRPSVFAYLRAELLGRYPNTIQAIADSPIDFIHIGLESLDPVNLKAVGKGFGGQRSIDLIYSMSEKFKHAHIGYSFIVGLPNDTQESVDHLFSTLKQIDLPNTTFTLLPLMINRSGNKRYSSIFDLEYAKYGYTFESNPNPVGLQDYWVNAKGYSQVAAIKDVLTHEIYDCSTQQTVLMAGHGIDIFKEIKKYRTTDPASTLKFELMAIERRQSYKRRVYERLGV